MHPVVAARIKKYASGPPKWSVIPERVTPAEKKTFRTLISKQKKASNMFHKYEVIIGQEKKAWKYYGAMFKAIDKIKKFQSMIRKKYS